MKVVILTLMLLLVLTHGRLHAQEPQLRTELVILCKDLSSTQVEKIHTRLNALEEVHFSCYYAPAQCLFITYDVTKVPEKTVMNTVRFGLLNSMQTIAVKGYKIYDIIDKGLTPELLSDQQQAFNGEE